MNEYSDLFRVRLFLKKLSEYSSTRYNCFTPIEKPSCVYVCVCVCGWGVRVCVCMCVGVCVGVGGWM